MAIGIFVSVFSYIALKRKIRRASKLQNRSCQYFLHQNKSVPLRRLGWREVGSNKDGDRSLNLQQLFILLNMPVVKSMDEISDFSYSPPFHQTTSNSRDPVGAPPPQSYYWYSSYCLLLTCSVFLVIGRIWEVCCRLPFETSS